MYDTESLGSGCVLPFMQAVTTGFLCGVVVTGGGLLLGYQAQAWEAGAAVCAAATLIDWLSNLRSWRRSVYGPEVYLPSEPAKTEPEPVRVELTSEEGRNMQLIDLPMTKEQAVSLARGLLDGQTFSESAWTGSGRPFSRSQFASLRAELIRRGLLVWSSPGTPARGCQLTRGGRACMRVFAAMAEPPPSLRKSSGQDFE